jgi:putative ABC transport system ATP-binding protein
MTGLIEVCTVGRDVDRERERACRCTATWRGVARARGLFSVGRRYSVGTNEVVALADVSSRVSAEESVVVLGPSGSGKTTLLNIIGALDSPSEGRVVVARQDITHASRKQLFAFRRHGVSFVFQTFNLFPALTALENVEFGADVAGRANAREIASEMLARVGLAERGAHFPHELSGGEQQRVSIARALGSGNPILLADEPTGELDFHTGVQILELLHAQAHTGRAVLLGVRRLERALLRRGRASPGLGDLVWRAESRPL